MRDTIPAWVDGVGLRTSRQPAALQMSALGCGGVQGLELPCWAAWCLAPDLPRQRRARPHNEDSCTLSGRGVHRVPIPGMSGDATRRQPGGGDQGLVS